MDAGELPLAGMGTHMHHDIDGLLQQASETLDANVRSGIYHQAEQLLMEEVPVIPVYHYNQMRLVDPALRGLPSRNLKGAIATKDLYFSQP